MRAHEARAPLRNLNARSRCRYVHVFRRAIVLDQLVLALDERIEWCGERRRGDTWIAWMARVIQQPRRFDEMLARQAATIRAGSADDTFLGHQDALAHLRRAQGCRESG